MLIWLNAQNGNNTSIHYEFLNTNHIYIYIYESYNILSYEQMMTHYSDIVLTSAWNNTMVLFNAETGLILHDIVVSEVGWSS